MKRLRGKPFALVGVSVDPPGREPERLREFMAKEDLNWRTFVDGRVIARQWNSPATPTFYVLDPAGTIRHKWVGSPGEKAIDAALEKLIRATEDVEAGR